jgi:hypothetical protein
VRPNRSLSAYSLRNIKYGLPRAGPVLSLWRRNCREQPVSEIVPQPAASLTDAHGAHTPIVRHDSVAVQPGVDRGRRCPAMQKATSGATRFLPRRRTATCCGSGLITVRVMGRLVVLQRHRGIASNYDCNRCSCPADYDSCDITPMPPSCLGPHAIMQATCVATFLSCNRSPIYRNVNIQPSPFGRASPRRGAGYARPGAARRP